MYPNNAFSKRRRDGWAERQRYFKRIVESVRPAPSGAKPVLNPTESKPKS